MGLVLNFSDVYGYKLLRQDEDYRYLKESRKKADYLDQIKFIPFNDLQTNYLTLGGEVRERYEYFSNFLWGDPLDEGDGYLLNRIMLHGDLHMGEAFRSFLQLKSGTVFDKTLPPRSIDEDKLDLHQFFIDMDLEKFIFRIGRQELAYGSSRLVSVREGPNVRQSFDGLKISYFNDKTKIDAFYTGAVETNPGVFDDGTEDKKLYGIYSTVANFTSWLDLDLYYLGLDRNDAEFEVGVGHESRHSVGTRLFHSSNRFSHDSEFVYQFGSFKSAPIKAWTLATNTAFTWSDHTLRPILGLKANIASGDTNKGDKTLGTFNALFPKGAYFNEAAIIGPSNIMDLHPYGRINLGEKASFQIEWDFMWRYSNQDGLYNIPLDQIVEGDAGNSYYIGSQLAFTFELEFAKHWSSLTQYMHFYTGNYLDEATPGKDIDFFTTWITYKF